MNVYSSAKVIVDGLDVADELRRDENPGHIGDFVLINVSGLKMLNGAQINAGAKIVGGGDFFMGDYSTVGYDVKILTGTDLTTGAYMNDYTPENARKVVRGKVALRRGAFIGSGAILTVSRKNPYLVIGERAVVMANSYVDEDVGKGMIYGHWGTEKIMKRRPGKSNS